MTQGFSAEYFDGETSRSEWVQVTLVTPSTLRVTTRHGATLRETPLGDLAISPRIANTRRSLRFPDGAALTSNDNDAVDALVAQRRNSKRSAAYARFEHWVHLLESNRRAAAFSIIGLLVLGVVGFIWGVPLIAKHVAMNVPDSVANDLGRGTLAALDHALFNPSRLSSERKAELSTAFDKMAKGYPDLPLKLVFRSAMPNAFALPNGTVVVTDELVELSKNTEEVMAVLAHEVGHVHERHALRMALENSMVALFALAYLGDASQMSVIAGSLPTIYANAHFSRAHETEADTFALEFLTEAQIPRHHFADILRRLHEELSGDTDGGALDYFSSHPGLEERVARFLTASP